MHRERALKLLNRQIPVLSTRFGVKHLGIFGSVARDEATDKSDVDLLVEFNSPITFDRYMDLKFFLEDLLHQPVDLVTQKALKPRLRDLIQQELIYVS